jgi:hypothetical protein
MEYSLGKKFCPATAYSAMLPLLDILVEADFLQLLF